MPNLYQFANKIEAILAKFVLAPLSFFLAIICLMAWAKGASTFNEFLVFGSSGLVMLSPLHYGIKTVLCMAIMYVGVTL